MKKLLITALCLTTFAVIFWLIQFNRHSPVGVPIDQNFSTDFAYDNKLFLTGVAYGQSKLNKDLPALRTIIIPHHLTASGLIVQGIFQLIDKSHPKTIVILSPNHADIGVCPVITSNKGWNTPFGTVEIDVKKTDTLLREKILCLDDKNMINEHGIAGLLPFIKYYLPETKIVPLAFKKKMSLSDLEDISQKISDLQDTVVIASVDFSHGLLPSESIAKDEETIHLITDKDINKISNLTSEYLDSPASIITLLDINEKLSLGQSLLAHSDARTLTQTDNKSNTTYFVFGFYPAPKTEEKWSLLATGDVMLGRSVNTQSIKNNDFTWAFKNIASLLKSADLTLINLESPLTKDCPSTDTGMIFCGKPENVQGLVYSGVDIANIANNHTNNYGKKGIDETISTLIANNISPVGLGETVVKNINNVEVAFAGFDAINKNIDKEVINTITDLKKKYTLVIVSLHWGTEYQQKPNQKQIDLAHLAIDSGADVIIGTHPHWVQLEETYKNKPIFYSLGNLIFDQMWSEETKKGMIVRLNFSKDKLLTIDHLPIVIYNYGQPKLAAQLQTP